MLWLIGLGLGKEDLSEQAIKAINAAGKVYLENYTSLIPGISAETLSIKLNKEIIPLTRKQVEEDKVFLEDNSALLVYGDPLAATTHQEILADAKKKQIEIKIIHAPSIFSVIAETGLQLYKFGKTASIPFWTESFKPESFFDVLEGNQSIGSHTLFLLDLKPEENKFMTAKQGVDTLLEVAKKRESALFAKDTLVVACARLGTESAKIISTKASEIPEDLGPEPHCLIVPGKMHFVEEDALKA